MGQTTPTPEPCPECGDTTDDPLLVQYNPSPTRGQVEAEHINTDDIPLVAGLVCPECGWPVKLLINAEANREDDAS